MDTHDAPDGLTQLKAGLEELRGLVLELKTTTQPNERADIRQDMNEVEADVEKLAKKYGLPASTIRDSIAAAKRAERKDEMRDVVRELLEEMIDADDHDEVVDEVLDEVEKPKPKSRTPKPDAVVEDQVQDTAPHIPHWGDRSIGDLLR